MNSRSRKTAWGHDDPRRVDYDDDLIVAYGPDGEVLYKGLFDYFPEKRNDDYCFNDSSGRYEHPDGYWFEKVGNRPDVTLDMMHVDCDFHEKYFFYPMDNVIDIMVFEEYGKWYGDVVKFDDYSGEYISLLDNTSWMPFIDSQGAIDYAIRQYELLPDRAKTADSDAYDGEHGEWYIYFDTMPDSGGELRMSLNNDKLRRYKFFVDFDVPSKWNCHWGGSVNFDPAEFGYSDDELMAADVWEVADIVEQVLVERRYIVGANSYDAVKMRYMYAGDEISDFTSYIVVVGTTAWYEAAAAVEDYKLNDPEFLYVDESYGELISYYDWQVENPHSNYEVITLDGEKIAKVAVTPTGYITINDLTDHDVYDSEEYWNGVSPQGHEVAVGIDYDYEPDAITVFIDGMNYDSVGIYGDDFGRAFKEAIERLSVLVFEMEHNMKFPRDYWNRPVIAEKDGFDN